MAISPRMMKVNPISDIAHVRLFFGVNYFQALIPVMSPLDGLTCVLRPVPTSRFRKGVPDQHKNQPWICEQTRYGFHHQPLPKPWNITTTTVQWCPVNDWISASITRRYKDLAESCHSLQTPRVGIGMIRKEPRLAGTNFRIASVTWPCSKILRIEWKKSTKTSHF
jgi:hypothetical protein